MSAANDGSESVDQFLARIASVKEGRDEAGEERKRRMEEEFLKNRTERQARRLERARSLSPSKTGPSRSTPVQTTSKFAPNSAITPPVDFSPRSSTLSRSNAIRTSPTLEPLNLRDDQSPASTTPLQQSPISNATSLSRTGTLSWQQRPSGSSGRPRPLSTIATVRSKQPDNSSEPSSPKEQTRSEIAAALGQKDPTWFRQTQDRGVGSAAYRKNQVEDTPVTDSSVRSMRLPGLSSAVSRDDRAQSPKEKSPGLEYQTRLRSDQEPFKSPPSPRATEVVKHEFTTETSRARTPTDEMSHDSKATTGIALGRSPSPTKGLGGFVQSAMMRRSDSVSKRWTVQAGTGLQRGDSIAGTRPRSGFYNTDHSTPRKDASDPSQSVSSETQTKSSLPASPTKLSYDPKEKDPDHKTLQNETTVSEQAHSQRPTSPIDRTKLTPSPSKALDSRRWSPTKSSWLETTLLAKQEPPKLSAKKEEQPQWMVDLHRSKSKKESSPERRSPLPGPKPFAGALKNDQAKSVSDIGEQLNTAQDVQAQNTASRSPLVAPTSTATPEIVAASKAEETPKDQQEESSGLSKDSVETTERRPPATKPKPQTPPRTDFRATLRNRPTTGGNGRDAEPEFKSMFGKLKPAQTKNYVAPDTFKDNILSGKNALIVTGGPQKTARVDEFKESILQKKQAMKANADDKQTKPSPMEPKKVAEPLPEALQRRKTLHKATPSVTKMQDELKSGATIQPKLKPVVAPKPKVNEGTSVDTQPSSTSLSQASLPPNSSTTSLHKEQSLVQGKTQRAESTSDTDKGSVSSALPSQLQRSKDTDSTRSLTKAQSSPLPSPLLAKSAPSQENQTGGLPAGSKLASRLNPNLASLISRGNAPRSDAKGSSPPESDMTQQHDPGQSQSKESETSGAELTHMTKGRARGPKRRAPKSQAAPARTIRSPVQPKSSAVTPSSPTKSPHAPASPTKSMNELKSIFSTPTSEEPQKAAITSALATNKSREEDSSKVLSEHTMIASKPTSKPKPIVANKSPDLHRVSSPTGPKTIEKPPPKPATPGKFQIAADKSVSPVSSPKPSPNIRTKPKPESITSPRPLTPSKSKINTLKQPSPERATPAKSSKAFDVEGKAVSESTNRAQTAMQNDLGPRAQPAGKAIPQSPVSELVDRFFSRNMPTSKDKAEFDTQALLESSTKEGDKVKTIDNTIWELGGDGKKIPMPPQQEHILYEDCMYLMVHTFESNGSKTSEVFLWHGDRVPGAAIDDVQIFCRKDAREHNAKLELLRQGKEPSRFFQALGGIVIIRRSKLSALYMLCGRKHLGHIAFDEVNFSVESLCSGFPYLISAKFGSLFLWKGKGSAIDEVGCARLIGMDLGLTGEMEEIDEGEEPASFWAAFADTSAKRSASTVWQQRNDHAAYPCTLYRVEHERPKSAGGFWGLRSASPPKTSNKAAVEILDPFCRWDIEQGNVYILDAYHAVYVLLDTKSSSKSAECATALHLAQEIAMLSPAIQGRSVLPSCYVIFGEPPRDVTNCFRKWEIKSPEDSNIGVSSPSVKLEDVMQALGF